MKAYKQAQPIDTINRIQNILNEIGILTNVQNIGSKPFYSCRVTVGNSDLLSLNIGTNGKGRSFEYSLASGYAEFVERIQNNILFQNKKYASKTFINSNSLGSDFHLELEEKNIVLDYVYDRCEKILPIQEVIKECSDDLKHLLNINTDDELKNFLINELNIQECYMIPFYSALENKVKNLPIEILMCATGSNGMAAGNVAEEALVQAFCEIFERFVAKQIYYNSLALPNIPIEYFKETPIYDEILYIKEVSNYEIIIKDCSLGLSLPVLGVLFIDKESQKYNFKLGSDFVPHIALERCFTEVHQGSVHLKSLDVKIFDLNDNPIDLESGIDHNFQKILIDHSGYWPISIFKDIPSKDIYHYDENYGCSDKSDLKKSLELINKLGYNNIYVRDNSVLGFPTYYVVVPGMSQILTNLNYYGLYKKSYKHITKRNLNDISKEKAFELAEAINDNYNLMKYFKHNNNSLYLYNIDEDLLELDIELLLFMLYYFSNEYDKSLMYLDLFLEEKEGEEFRYYFCIRDYVSMKYCKEYSKDDICSILYKKYGKSQLDEVITDISSPDEIFKYYEFPNCFNCNKCKVKNSCSYFSVIRIMKKIELSSNKHLDQLNLKEYLNYAK